MNLLSKRIENDRALIGAYSPIFTSVQLVEDAAVFIFNGARRRQVTNKTNAKSQESLDGTH